MTQERPPQAPSQSAPDSTLQQGDSIERILVETFTIGGYTYTNRADAQAQARRMRSADART